jgi:DNA-binding SARP family transcriptional activator
MVVDVQLRRARMPSEDVALLRTAPARVALLEGFEVTLDGHAVPFPLAVQRLIAFLAVQARPTLRLHVAGVLWPDTPEERASANLRSTLWRHHQAGCRLVKATGQHLALAPDVRVDLRELSVLAHRLLEGSFDPDDLEYGRLCQSGELLADWYDDWVLVERERFRQLRLHALEKLCEEFTRRRLFGLAVQAGVACVAGEPLRESAQRVLIRAYLAEGNRGEAIRQYQAYRGILKTELGLEPTAEMQSLVDSLSTR